MNKINSNINTINRKDFDKPIEMNPNSAGVESNKISSKINGPNTIGKITRVLLK